MHRNLQSDPVDEHPVATEPTSYWATGPAVSNRVTRVAAKLFDVPISILTLSNDSCSPALHQGDAKMLASGSNHLPIELQAVEEPLAFHASHPVYGPCGSVVADLELMDNRHRRFTDHDRQLLGELAALAELELQAAAHPRPGSAEPGTLALGLGPRARSELEYLALHDPLTGLANRRLLTERIEQALAGITSGHGGVGILFLDIDGFKHINDSWGHEAGDHVIVEAASRLAATVRCQDTAARLGGDEFVLVCTELEDVHAGTQIADRLNHRFRRPITIRDAVVRITWSGGFVLARDATADPRELLRLADQALYRAKIAGRNRIELVE